MEGFFIEVAGIEFRVESRLSCYPSLDSRDIVDLASKTPQPVPCPCIRRRNLEAIGSQTTLWGGVLPRMAPEPVLVVTNMDVILKVLEGAKVGAKIAVKKDQFLIGRSSKCHLCAGSTAVSRKHCVISRSGTKISIKDLGSRNGTLVNGEKIAGEVELSSGDEVTVGPLRFLLTITQGINNEKRTKVESVAEAVDRTVASNGSDITADDDISRWLLEPAKPSQSATETRTLSMDETHAIQAKLQAEKIANDEANVESENPPDKAESVEEDSSHKKKKQEPGKLPYRPNEPATKDSRDAASAALRNWNRRS